ncbi:hypothetical protein B0T17DRAFT_512379 [Bombardia bombarda]|uniref:MPN domain-containing protein n=1 Tax=Bombardia bombarda TaxID=252184 RepID=A0AA39WBK4_9PEZI|nr:hypothetical protein B0T17DRAFT_512379 [Bombardia bombarda]
MDNADLQVDHKADGRPMNVTELSDKAKQYDWNPRIRFKYWARAAETLHHEGQVYWREGNAAQAYMFLLRYSFLVIDNLPEHPEAKEPEARKATRPLEKRLPKVIDQLERIRPQIEKSYDEWVRITAAQRDLPRDSSRPKLSQYERHAANDPALSWSHVSPAKILDAGEYQDLAIDLAKGEMNRRRRRQAGGSDDDERRRRSAGLWDGWNYIPHNSSDSTYKVRNSAKPTPQYMDDEELRRQMEATRRQLDYSDAISQPRELESDSLGSTSYYYPSIYKSSSVIYESPSSPVREKESPRLQPPRPPKESVAPPRPTTIRPLPRLPPPPRPVKEPLTSDTPTDDTLSGLEVAPPPPPKIASTVGSPKKDRVTFRPAAYLENGDPLRTVFLPSTLRQKFLNIAWENTRQGLEMCGMLCGTPVNNALFISCLLIPEQHCTSDTCETENESGMLDYCMTNDLLIIGWIHTHPTQSCFMSSRDLHTHAGYQVMMPESIAIVCAPSREPSWGIFRLTNPPGLPHILGCHHNDTFHQHSIENIYTAANHPPGHVFESSNLEVEVHDLRPGH